MYFLFVPSHVQPLDVEPDDPALASNVTVHVFLVTHTAKLTGFALSTATVIVLLFNVNVAPVAIELPEIAVPLYQVIVVLNPVWFATFIVFPVVTRVSSTPVIG